MSPARLGAVASDIFGEDRVTVTADLADAIEAAVRLAEAALDGGLSGVGVLVAGGVVTVADARKLLRR